MVIKLTSRHGDVYVNTSNVTFFRQSQNGTIIFFGNTGENYTEVSEKPEAVVRLMKTGR